MNHEHNLSVDINYVMYSLHRNTLAPFEIKINHIEVSSNLLQNA